MARVLAVAAACLLCLTLAVPVAAKGPPEIFTAEPTVITAEDLAGTCDFPVEIVDSSTNSRAIVFPADANGDQHTNVVGGFTSTITNLDSRKSREIKFYGHAHYVFHADGTIDIDTGGTILVWYTADDVLSVFDPGVYLVTGQMHLHVDAETFLALQPEQVKGKVVDLCAALS